MKKIGLLITLCCLGGMNSFLIAQQNTNVDTSSVLNRNGEEWENTSSVNDYKYKTRFPKDFIAPAILIGYGLTTIKDNGIYSSFQARRDIQKHLGGAASKIDDYLIFAPYVEFGGLLLFKINCRNDFVNTSLLVLKTQFIMAGITFPFKYIAAQERPYSYFDEDKTDAQRIEDKANHANSFQSLPSGHTAQAFAAAAIVNKEFRYYSPWPGVAAYSLAGTVALYRMINDKHWQSDVLVGAGIGILSANIAYATHQFRWGRKEVCVVPTFGGKQQGFMLVANF